MRVLTFIFQIIWIILFPVIGGVVAWATGESSYGYIGIISIIAIFDLVWFCLSMNTKEMGIINKVGNLIILDIPAFLTMKKWFSENKTRALKKEVKENRYKKEISSDLNNREENYDIDIIYTPKEIEYLENKQKQKNKKIIMNDKSETTRLNHEVEYERKVVRGFGVYLLYLIYKNNPELTNTYDLIQEYNKMVNQPQLRTKETTDFLALKNISEFIQDYDAKKDTYQILNQTPNEEIIIALKQDRVDMVIDAKSILKKEQTKKLENKTEKNDKK
ncbi:hypothetical protein [Mesoplasma lactucae]|uniref:Uncharacterized protein n=1 Tax=Mesoplasma lactucae ATCC 49193 TaxID=81460 RepID=A0A291IS10_9MOLU|nr:hypothetical protein [Mesoplasma lactucae]ATG97534.1 hypothetical protein CP520_02080 [Mesoplasma lactucae ATCC 49193]ATZ20008.1 hypothetical protein MLACT_v1c01860 [Mesoplasma lactucae ATCC 49193]MCL8217041.1 hypothetical protein [Mesoplasma lactucae ATCC 49193]